MVSLTLVFNLWPWNSTRFIPLPWSVRLNMQSLIKVHNCFLWPWQLKRFKVQYWLAWAQFCLQGVNLLLYISSCIIARGWTHLILLWVICDRTCTNSNDCYSVQYCMFWIFLHNLWISTIPNILTLHSCPYQQHF